MTSVESIIQLKLSCQHDNGLAMIQGWNALEKMAVELDVANELIHTACELFGRYLKETPPGHSPSMIVHAVEEWMEKAKEQK